jgi:hypothetical protein
MIFRFLRYIVWKLMHTCTYMKHIFSAAAYSASIFFSVVAFSIKKSVALLPTGLKKCLV